MSTQKAADDAWKSHTERKSVPDAIGLLFRILYLTVQLYIVVLENLS